MEKHSKYKYKLNGEEVVMAAVLRRIDLAQGGRINGAQPSHSGRKLTKLSFGSKRDNDTSEEKWKERRKERPRRGGKEEKTTTRSRSLEFYRFVMLCDYNLIGFFKREEMKKK